MLFHVHVVSPVTVWGHLSLTLDCREFSYCIVEVSCRNGGASIIITAHSELQKVVLVGVTRDKKGHFSALSAGCVRFMFGKTSLASSFLLCL